MSVHHFYNLDLAITRGNRPEDLQEQFDAAKTAIMEMEGHAFAQEVDGMTYLCVPISHWPLHLIDQWTSFPASEPTPLQRAYGGKVRRVDTTPAISPEASERVDVRPQGPPTGGNPSVGEARSEASVSASRLPEYVELEGTLADGLDDASNQESRGE